MKTLTASLLALGLISSAASAQYCPPGYGFRAAHGGPVAKLRQVEQSQPVAPAPAEAAPAPVQESPAPAPEPQK
jgi:hypothetical protein